jgi:sugar-specific transcriptional regulator TrmB
MSEKEELINIGLSSRQADAYLAVLQLREATVREIADKTRESRTHIYDTLKSLIDKGLVACVIKNNIKYFYAASPEKLLDYLHEKENSILKILPNLKKAYGKHGERPIVEVYEGKEGMKTILNDIIRSKKEWLVIGSTGGGPYVLHDFFIEKFHKERVKNKIKLKVLFNDTPNGRKRATTLQQMQLIETKFLPPTHQSPATIYIYDYKTAIIIWLAIGKPFAILIESKEISHSFRFYFNLLWNLPRNLTAPSRSSGKAF